MASSLRLRAALRLPCSPFLCTARHAPMLYDRTSFVLAIRPYASAPRSRKTDKSKSNTKQAPHSLASNISQVPGTQHHTSTALPLPKHFPTRFVDALTRLRTTFAQVPATVLNMVVLELPDYIGRLPARLNVGWDAWREGFPMRSWWWLNLKRLLKILAHICNIFIWVHIIYTHFFRISLTLGPSMLPTFATSGEAVLEDIFSYRHLGMEFERGDLVSAESPIMRGHIVCKRIIGLPGDIVCVDPTGQLAPSTEHVVIPKGHVWLSGDNADWSRDSREYGPVPLALVKGRIVARIWPPSKFTIYRKGDGLNYLT